MFCWFFFDEIFLLFNAHPRDGRASRGRYIEIPLSLVNHFKYQSSQKIQMGKTCCFSTKKKSTIQIIPSSILGTLPTWRKEHACRVNFNGRKEAKGLFFSSNTNSQRHVHTQMYFRQHSIFSKLGSYICRCCNQAMVWRTWELRNLALHFQHCSLVIF